MAKHHLLFIFFGWLWRQSFAPPCGIQFPENPRVSECAPSNHDKITSGFFHHGKRGGTVGHVAVSDNGNVNRFFHGGDDRPVGAAAVKLFARAAVHGYRGSPGCRSGACDLNRVYRGVVPACTDFYRNRLAGSFYRSFDDVKDELRVLHQSRALAVFHDFGYRASHVDVEERIAARRKLFRRESYNFRFMAENLISNRILSV